MQNETLMKETDAETFQNVNRFQIIELSAGNKTMKR